MKTIMHCNNVESIVYSVFHKLTTILSHTAMTCQSHATYKICVSGCPKTCSNINDNSKCTMACSEGCECDDGYVLSGDKCVPVDQCGCTGDTGRYYLVRLHFKDESQLW